MGLVGVHQAAPGSTDWVWLCACGASGDGADREKAREQYRVHRSTCGEIPQLEVQVPTAKKTPAAKKVATKTAAKKTVTKTAAKSKRAVLLSADDSRLAEVVKRMKAGSGLIEEARKLGFTHNGPLRAALPKYLGGKKQYEELMATSRKNAAPVVKKEKPVAKKKTPAKANPAPVEPPAALSATAEGATS